jgi:osmoprotectant transport system ATP-binding protein
MAGQAAELVFDEATKRYGDHPPAVDRLSLTVPAGEICVLVGPSGGGKTTALKLVNRLIPLTSGDIRIDGRSIEEQDVTQLRRGIGYVIQNVGLFPHQTVEANIGTVPRLYGRDRKWIRERPTRSAIRARSPAVSGSASASRERSPRTRRCS